MGRSHSSRGTQWGSIGRYKLLHRIAIGGMGEIFLARETGVAGFDRLVAVKRLIPELAERPEMVELFVDEARIAAHLAHPNVVHVHELGSDEGAFFLSMEYVPGQNLARVVERAARVGEKIPRPMWPWEEVDGWRCEARVIADCGG